LGLPSLLSVALGPLAPLASGVQNVTAEPPLACYVSATCTGSAAPTLRLAYTVHRRKATVVHVRVNALEGYALDPVGGVTVRLAGHTKTTNGKGDVTFRVKSLHKRYRITASRPGCNPVTKSVIL
jgi:hypothetical protein